MCAQDLRTWVKKKDACRIPSKADGLNQMASALAHVHEKGHAHRDICPGNILISLDGDRLILSDFGLCKKVHDTGSFSDSRSNGQDNWFSPERLKRKFDPDNCTPQHLRLTINSDTFSLGCVFYFFLSEGGHPFGDGNDFEVQTRITKGIFTMESKC